MVLRILHIFAPNHYLRFSGATIRWRSYFEHWDDSSVVHYVIDTNQNKIYKANDDCRLKNKDSQYITSFPKRFFWIFKLLKTLIKHKEKFDILHLHVLWWGGLLSILWSSFKKIPTIYESVLLNADTPDVILKQTFGSLKLWLLKRITAILAISDAIAEVYIKNGFKENQVFILMNIVDSQLFFPPNSEQEKRRLRQKYRLPLDASIILFTGSIIHRKGVDVIIHAFIEANQYIDDVFLMLIGPQNILENPSLDEAYVNQLKKSIDEQKLTTKVKFLGLIKDRFELSEYYRASDVFVFPSRSEGLGNVVLEAMSSGLPVIVSDLPVLKSVVNHAENSWVVPIDDVDELTKAFLYLHEDPKFARQLGQNGRDYILHQHTFSTWQAALVDIYQRLLSSRG